MIKGVMSIALAVLVACAGCAGRKGATLADVTPSGTPRSTPQPTPRPPATQEPPLTGTGSENRGAAPATSNAAPGEAPPATASAYVYSPQQAVSATRSPSPEHDPQRTPPRAKVQRDASGQARGELQLLVVVSATEVATGDVMTVDVMASSSTAVVDAPLHLTADPSVLEFVDGTPGDFLTQGGSSVVFLTDGRSRPGDVAIAAGRVAREEGASGSGLLCRVRFRGVGAGTTPVSVAQAKAWGTAGEELTVRSAGATVVVR